MTTVLSTAPSTELLQTRSHELGDAPGRGSVVLAAFKVPSTWQVVDELPKASTGKIDKKPLRESLAT